MSRTIKKKLRKPKVINVKKEKMKKLLALTKDFTIWDGC